MVRTVLFRDEDRAVLAESFIARQDVELRPALARAAETLSSRGTIEGARVFELEGGDWSLWLEDGRGQRVRFVLFVSQLEGRDVPERRQASVAQRELVIEDPAGARDSAGGAHPGHWSVEQYAAGMDEVTRSAFLSVMDDLRAGRPSPYCIPRPDGRVDIALHRPDLAYGVHVTCTVRWL